MTDFLGGAVAAPSVKLSVSVAWMTFPGQRVTIHYRAKQDSIRTINGLVVEQHHVLACRDRAAVRVRCFQAESFQHVISHDESRYCCGFMHSLQLHL